MADIKVTVTAQRPETAIENAKLSLLDAAGNVLDDTKRTSAAGVSEFKNIAPGNYTVRADAFGQVLDQAVAIVNAADAPSITIKLPLEVIVKTYEHGTVTETNFCSEGEVVDLEAILNVIGAGIPAAAIAPINPPNNDYSWSVDAGAVLDPPDDQNSPKVHWDTTGAAGLSVATVKITDKALKASILASEHINVREGRLGDQRRSDSVNVSLRRTSIERTDDQALWVAIRNRTQAVRFDAYKRFIDKVLCRDRTTLQGRNRARFDRQYNELYTPIQGVGAYELLKTATQVFLLLECGVAIEDPERYSGQTAYDAELEEIRLGRRIPLADIQTMLSDYLGGNTYIKTILANAFEGLDPELGVFCNGYLGTRADCPLLLELIWSYWHEESMLAQSMNAISLRFQNRRSAAARDPLAHLEISSLFPLNNLLWGYIQDEQQRLSVQRRVYEYDHHYGLTLAGKAVQDFRPADTRSKFLEAFHHLLYLCTVFLKQDDDTTVIADGFPILNALKEVHLLLAEGAHNQFGDLPWTARAEMLAEQWILARPEMLRFLHGRDAVPYREPWMAQVDTMKRLQGWTDVTVTHFNDLAIYGEQIFLSIRYGNWNIENLSARAANWARYWRPEIQNYIHGYRAITGVDLTAEPVTNQQRQLMTTLPTLLIQERLLTGKSAPALPAPMLDKARSFRERQAARRANGG